MSETQPPPMTQLNLFLSWPPKSLADPQWASHFIVAPTAPTMTGVTDRSVVLGFGRADIPVFAQPPFPSADAPGAEAQTSVQVEVKPLGAFIVSHERLVELHRSLGEVIAQQEQGLGGSV